MYATYERMRMISRVMPLGLCFNGWVFECEARFES